MLAVDAEVAKVRLSGVSRSVPWPEPFRPPSSHLGEKTLTVTRLRCGTGADGSVHEGCAGQDDEACGTRGLLDDAAYRDVSVEQILTLIPDGYEASILVVVDKTAITSAEIPVLLIDLNELNEEYGRTFRVIPGELPSIEVNLSLGNMDFFELADSVDDDGVFRGFTD
ncbi:hypothetical protein GCM10010191_01740 [Actinomadura vinacea]|uniref:DUF6924 domain-containing protein n=1 Tax=Actinomadura vinacea TaxID=115336 RepID=A0ABP5VBA6_9ACTN